MFGRFPAAVLVGLALACPAVELRQNAGRIAEAVEMQPRRRYAAAALRPRRSRGAQARPKRKPNRMHISRRARRKHRSAA